MMGEVKNFKEEIGSVMGELMNSNG